MQVYAKSNKLQFHSLPWQLFLCTIQVVSEVNLQILRVILLGNEQLGQEHFLQCRYNLVGKLNNVSLLLVKEQSCSLFHVPDNKRSFPQGFHWLPSSCFPPTQDKNMEN